MTNLIYIGAAVATSSTVSFGVLLPIELSPSLPLSHACSHRRLLYFDGNLVCLYKITWFLTPTVERTATINIRAPSETNKGMPSVVDDDDISEMPIYRVKRERRKPRLCGIVHTISLSIWFSPFEWFHGFAVDLLSSCDDESDRAKKKWGREKRDGNLGVCAAQLKNIFISIYLFFVFIRDDKMFLNIYWIEMPCTRIRLHRVFVHLRHSILVIFFLLSIFMCIFWQCDNYKRKY